MGSVQSKNGHLAAARLAMASPQEGVAVGEDQGVAVGEDQGGKQVMVLYGNGIVLYCTILYYTVLYCSILYYTVLYCTILYRWWWGL